MAANINPIFPKVGNVSWAKLNLANPAVDGTGSMSTVFTAGTVSTVFTAGAEGSRVDKISFQPLGTNDKTVVRVFINKGDNSTALNNTLYLEQTINATIASTDAALPKIEVPIDLILPAGYKLICTLGTAVASGIQVTVEGGDY